MLAEAEACYRAGLDLADASGMPELRACARGELGRFLLLHDRIPEGLALVKAALALARACGSRRAQARALLVLGWHYNRLQDGRRARHCLRRALPLVEALGEPNHIGRAWLDLSVAYQRLKDIDRAEKAARRALAYFKRSGDLRLQAQTWQRLGILHFGRKRYQQAARLFLHTRQAYERLGDPHELAAVYSNLGAAYWGLQDWPRAEAYTRRALALARRLNLEGMEINLLVNFGWIYLEQPKSAEAAAALREARAQLEARAGRAELADWVRLKLGEVAELEARLAAAAGTADERR
jgi:tetratricopeptide (TPR) repeat protein